MAAEASPLLNLLARSGYAARGVVYLLVGATTALSAVGAASGEESPREAIASMIGDTGSEVLLAIIVAGLVGFVVWRLTQTFCDTDRHGTDAKGLVIRAGLFMSAVSYGFLAIYAIALLAGWTTADGGRSSWASRLFHWPFGLWLIAGVGLVIIGVGLAHFFKGVRAGFEKHFEMDEQLLTVLSPICQFGLIARGVVFLIIGGFFIAAAATSDPSEVGGTSKALDWLSQSDLGWIALLVVAVGLLAFGIYSLIESRWRRVTAPA